MDNLISKQGAIDALFELYEYQRYIDPTEAADRVRQGVYLAEKKIEQLPSVQPDHVADISKKVEGDCISRQMAIDAIKDALDPHIVQFVKSKMAIEALPSVQPEIIRKPVIGYEGYYEVDNCGRVYALNRVIHVEDHGRSYDKHLVGGILKQHMHSNGYKIVPLTKDGKTKKRFRSQNSCDGISRKSR